MRREGMANAAAEDKPKPKPKAMFGGLVIEQRSLPVITRSPSWSHPGDREDKYYLAGKVSLKAVPKVMTMHKIAMWAAMILVNNCMVFFAARILWTEYMLIDSDTSFGAGLTVSGSLTADRVEVTVDGPQVGTFRSLEGASAMTVMAADGAVTKLVLGKTSSPDWVVANSRTDQFELGKGGQNFLTIDAPSRLSTVKTHIDTLDATLYGSPLIFSTGAPLPIGAPCSSHADCGAGRCNGTVCGHGVGAADILLAPGAGGSVRLHGDLEPVSGDFVIKPAERIAVRKQAGVVGAGHLVLEDTQVHLLTAGGSACVADCRNGTCPAGVANELACPGRNVLRTLTAEQAASDIAGQDGSLSLSDTVYVHPQKTTSVMVNGTQVNTTTGSVGINGQLDVGHHGILGSPLYLKGSNVTIEALVGGAISLKSPMKVTGPVTPTQMVGRLGAPVDGPVPMGHVQGTVKVQNLQFELVETESGRPDSSPQPVIGCDYESVGRHGWIRLTMDSVANNYHLYFCTENGWKPL